MSEKEKESVFKQSKNCIVTKTNAGITWGVIVIILIASVSGIGGYYLTSYMQKRHETRLNVSVGNFYLHLYKNNTDLGINSNYELGGIGFYFMVYDKDIWDVMVQYDNFSEYCKATNETLDNLIGSIVIMQSLIWGDVNHMVDSNDGNYSVLNIDNQTKVGLDNKTNSFSWGEDKVVLLSGVEFLIYNRTTTSFSTITMYDPFDIIGQSINDTVEDNADFINITKTYRDVAYYPNNIYELTILGMDYDIITHDGIKLYVQINGVDTTITDRELTTFVI